MSDPVTAAFLLLLTFGLGTVVGLMVNLDRHNRDTFEPHPPVSEPIKHVKPHMAPFEVQVYSDIEDRLHLSLFGTYRGQVHSPFCVSADGTDFECECDEVSA